MRFDATIKRWYQKKCASRLSVIAIKAVAHKLARACYHAASFWLEAGFNVDTGTGAALGGLSFNRRSTVSLSGALGEVRLGRDYTPTFWNDSVFDPFPAMAWASA